MRICSNSVHLRQLELVISLPFWVLFCELYIQHSHMHKHSHILHIHTHFGTSRYDRERLHLKGVIMSMDPNFSSVCACVWFVLSYTVFTHVFFALTLLSHCSKIEIVFNKHKLFPGRNRRLSSLVLMSPGGDTQN